MLQKYMIHELNIDERMNEKFFRSENTRKICSETNKKIRS